MNYLLTSTPPSAKENYEIIRSKQAEKAANFIDCAIAIFWIRELKQYEQLGFTRLEVFLASQGIEMSKADYHNKANLGEMLRWINATREELIDCGPSALQEIARLAKGKGMAEKNKAAICRLINGKAKGLLDIKQVIEQVRAILGGDKKQADSTPKAPVNTAPVETSDDDNADDNTPATEDWRAPFLKMLHAAKDAADYFAQLDDMRGE